MSMMVRAEVLPHVNPQRAGFPVVRQRNAPNEMILSRFGQAEDEGFMRHLENPWVAGGIGVAVGVLGMMAFQRMQGF